MIRAGDQLFYVASNGNVSLVAADSDEVSGQVAIVGTGGAVITANTGSLFRTQSAANRAAVSKGKVAAPAQGLFVRTPQ